MDFNEGKILDNKYQLISSLGKGGFGQVWLSRDLLLNSTVALKIIPSALSDFVKNIKEAIIGHKFIHPNLIRIYNAELVPFEIGSTRIVLTLIAEEYHKNGTITSLINNHNFLDSNSLIRLLKELLLGLEHLHANGIYHNDIKPANILIDNNGQAILSDYGISGVSQNNTPVQADNAYILHEAPETITSGLIDAQTDIYQLGCTAYRLVNGLNELNTVISNDRDILYKNKLNFNSKQRNKYIPKKLSRIIQKAMASKDLRYKTALEMRRDLEKLNFSGYWTDDPEDKQLIAGFDTKYIYRFKVINSNRGYVMNATKQSLRTGSITKISKFCVKHLNKREADKLQDTYIESVITGNI